MTDDKVVDILSRQPHFQGKAVCLHCKHTWQFVAPLGVAHFECPSCHLDKGVPQGLAVPEWGWTCACGCCHFFVSPNNIICALCGKLANFDNAS